MGVQRRTSPKRLKKSANAFKEWIVEFRHNRIGVIMEALNRKLRGYWNYYGVRGNSDSLTKLYYRINQLLFAIAAVNGIDIILSLNFKHINNPLQFGKIRKTVESMGYQCPEICSPEQLLENEDD
ncbi:MAG: hypothetical protein LAT79_13610 [Kiritimatiellae bacterium]|nr:hypothetical protein [Kiritimatiellia bacterium]